MNLLKKHLRSLYFSENEENNEKEGHFLNTSDLNREIKLILNLVK